MLTGSRWKERLFGGPFKLIRATDQGSIMATCPSLHNPSSFLFLTILNCFLPPKGIPITSDITPSSQPLLTLHHSRHHDCVHPPTSHHPVYREHFHVMYYILFMNVTHACLHPKEYSVLDCFLVTRSRYHTRQHKNKTSLTWRCTPATSQHLGG